MATSKRTATSQANTVTNGLWVVDTSAWIEWLVDGPLRSQLVPLMPPRERCVVPTIVQLELSKWLVRERGEDEADVVIAYTQKCQVWPLDTATALRAAELHREYKLATADAIVYASALLAGAQLLTCDAHFKDLPQVRWIQKTGAAL
ncbi:MAG: type II toxin-antitoxin system VapC family toxin [Burkholderiaceae bacterium]